MNLFTDRKYLHDRHRLSHQQIDRLLGESFAKNYLQEKIKAMELVRQLIGLADLLNEHNIPFISFKGPLLSQQIYGDPTVRISHDLDVLVNVQDVDKVNTIMLENGYQYINGIGWPKGEKQQKMIIASSKDLTFQNIDTGHIVELHWSFLVEIPVEKKKLESILVDNKRTIDFYGRMVNTFDDEFNLLYLVIHGAIHGWSRLKWLVDIKDFPFERIDEKKFIILVERLNANRIISQTHSLLLHFFYIDIPLFKCNYNSRFITSYSINNIKSNIETHLSLRYYFTSCWYRGHLFEGIYYKLRIINTIFSTPIDYSKITLPYRIAYVLYRPYSYIKRHLIHAE
jgi:hypothetical protein